MLTFPRKSGFVVDAYNGNSTGLGSGKTGLLAITGSCSAAIWMGPLMLIAAQYRRRFQSPPP